MTVRSASSTPGAQSVSHGIEGESSASIMVPGFLVLLATVFVFLGATGFADSVPEQEPFTYGERSGTAPRGRRLWR